MSRAPDIIGAAHVIARAPSIVWPISNLDRNRAWIGAITGAVRTITGITGAVRRITVIISASACAEGDRKQKEQESRPFPFRSSRGGDSLHLRAINNLCSHIRKSKGKAARCEEKIWLFQPNFSYRSILCPSKALINCTCATKIDGKFSALALDDPDLQPLWASLAPE
jgi:hypothetical protein